MPPNPQITQPEGHKNDIAIYRKGRKCKLCKTPLTRYTPGPCCNAHQHAWTELESAAEDIKMAAKRKRDEVLRRARVKARKEEKG